MKILRLNKGIEEKIKEAARILREGGLVVYPTDTLYGLGANALDEKAVERVFKVKKRPFSKPLPIAVNSLEMMRRYASVNERAECLAERFLPGAVTLVLNKRDIPDVLTAGSEKVAIRIPKHEVALKLIEFAGSPITTTSANLTGMIPPISVEEVVAQIKVDVILDGGRLGSRIPSTLVDITGEPKILREGKIKREEIERVIGRK
jgi:L-threonylcarbamoyladenylate synthase